LEAGERISEKQRMAATQLTPAGWSGATTGTWSNQANVVIDRKRGVEVVGKKLINALDGDDVITGEKDKGPGFFVPNQPRRGNFQLGEGNDALTGISKAGYGIENRGFIYAGPGGDTIVASGNQQGLRNRGFIFTQGDNDRVDASDGGIRGRGFVDLGAGNNTFLGFGEHLLYGGGGRDTLLLPKGTYELSRSSGTRYRLERGNNRLELFDFDVIGAIDGRKSQRIEIDGSGTLVVRNDGRVTLT
jgi:hypothetical protein